jgi:uncharacterized protein YdaT
MPAMPWTDLRYPNKMRHLSYAVRARAIETANALLAEGLDEGCAIRIGIAQAQRWAARRMGVPPLPPRRLGAVWRGVC